MPSEREMDMLLATGEQTTIALTAMALHAHWRPGGVADRRAGGHRDRRRAYQGEDSKHHAETGPRLLDAGNVVIVAGFQGQTQEGQITTLGRGGSDLTAIALAAALKADLCQIYTDVDGVYTADPRIVPERAQARRNFLRRNARTRQPRREGDAVAARSSLPKNSASSSKSAPVLNDNPGTIVKEETKSMEDVVIRGVSLDKNQAKVTLVAVPDKPGVAATHFQGARRRRHQRGHDRAEHQPRRRHARHRYFLHRRQTRSAQGAKGHRRTQSRRSAIGEVISDEKIGKLSIVGVGMRSHSGVAAKMFETLANEGVNIEMISTSEIKISVVIDLAKGEAAMKACTPRF